MTEEEKLELLWIIAQSVAHDDIIVPDDAGDMFCFFCNGSPDRSNPQDYRMFQHDHGCIVLIARKLVGEPQKAEEA